MYIWSSSALNLTHIIFIGVYTRESDGTFGELEYVVMSVW